MVRSSLFSAEQEVNTFVTEPCNKSAFLLSFCIDFNCDNGVYFCSRFLIQGSAVS